MKPVAIFRHSPGEGPGYFAAFLEQHQIPWVLIAIDEGAPVPVSASHYAGLCLMGGTMSVNDSLPWIEPLCALIRHAITHDIPVIGHCLGGQLMSKALGGVVSKNPVKEIGWSTALAENHSTAKQWLGNTDYHTYPLFQWHGETFSLPPGAECLLRTAACTNQAFALGPHLGMQCHIEMTPEMIAAWCKHWNDDCADLPEQPSIQSPDVMLAETPKLLPELRALANQLYGEWIKNLKT